MVPAILDLGRIFRHFPLPQLLRAVQYLHHRAIHALRVAEVMTAVRVISTLLVILALVIARVI